MAAPTYHLYGEAIEDQREFWVHCETIASRSSEYRWEIGLHRHDSFLQFLYIRHGSGDALLPQGRLALTPPCVIVVPPGPVHGFRFSPDIDGFVITLVPARFKMGRMLTIAPPFFANPAVVALAGLGAEGDFLSATLLRIAEEYETDMPMREDMIESHVVTAILILARLTLARLSETEAAMPPADIHERRVHRLRDLIARHHREQLSVDHYAAMLGLSATHLNRSTRQVTGLSLHDLIMERSMDEACRQLVFTDYSVRHVGEGLGFTDPAYFSRCFRQRIGVTPRQYRDGERAKLRNKEAAASVNREQPRQPEYHDERTSAGSGKPR
ncbi:helix-turn-helix domain-containing protein [Rhizobium sp. SSA_523]|uniref:helix-turn-helix domain-containing protein n=1 Tax=Rhizobium sp. SSA_523 TaxID=2952477 RepID=UPI0020910FF4|nr:helix-turn-helix domain-containing protein [Rhizobium sp. SSA_523]MCO5733259.1 helix-turn-helix domain-containing protein [Rhizobium sp. SSA_523]WKC21755.1 helix-turn-helix domain-containing protein [Rhizobium sp. SSA_523]